MWRMTPVLQHYDWGSPTEIPDLLGLPAGDRPVAEAWYGAHPLAPSSVIVHGEQRALTDVIDADPASSLGRDVTARFGVALPYLLKVLAADRPLSLQVHPSLEQAAAGFERENRLGIPRESASRCFRDANHKPELIYALSRVEALSGFRSPRRAVEVFAELDAILAQRICGILRANLNTDGMQRAFEMLLSEEDGPNPTEIDELVAACRERLAEGSSAPRSDRTVLRLAEEFPSDPGIAASLLLNPVTLRPGETLFIPAGGVHSYQSGVMVEVMASSDNVLRAGLTSKPIDRRALLECVDYVAAPPVRIAAEEFEGATRVFYAPVDDFELSVTTLTDHAADHRLPGRGPRILLCLAGNVTVAGGGERLSLAGGQAAFVPASTGRISAHGVGTIVQADAP